jgi:hypothetical protein
MAPPFSGVLTTVSFLSPQAHTVAGITEESSRAAQAAAIVTNQITLKFLTGFISLFTSRDE